jgi:hypothetical protein
VKFFWISLLLHFHAPSNSSKRDAQILPNDAQAFPRTLNPLPSGGQKQMARRHAPNGTRQLYVLLLGEQMALGLAKLSSDRSGRRPLSALASDLHCIPVACGLTGIDSTRTRDEYKCTIFTRRKLYHRILHYIWPRHLRSSTPSDPKQQFHQTTIQSSICTGS